MILLIFFILIFLGRANSSVFGYEFLNTDEFVIGAKAMRLIDNFPITKFDGDTSGILNAIFLTWPNLFNLDISYLSIRITGIFAISCSLYFTYKIINQNLEKKKTIILITPLVLFFALTKDPDFLHYTNELISILLIVSSIFFYFKSDVEKFTIYLVLASILLGSVIFAKMQFFPVACLMIAIINIRLLFFEKNLKKTLFSSLSFFLPIVILSVYHYSDGQLRDLYYNVIHYPFSDLFSRNEVRDENLVINSNSIKNILVSSKKTIFINHFLYNSLFHLLYLYFFYFLFYIYFIYKKKLINRNLILSLLLEHKMILISLSILFTIFIIIITGSVHRHYFVNLIPLIPVFLSIFIFNISKQNQKKFEINLKYHLILIFIFSMSLLFENKKFYSTNFNHQTFYDNKKNFNSPEIFQFLKLNKKVDKLIVWGWKPELYLLSGLTPGTRETVNQKQIDFKSNRNYFRERFLNDFQESKPNIVLDYVKAKGNYFNNSETSGIKSFPKFYKEILKDFKKINSENINCPDLYLRNDTYKKLEKRIVPFEILYNGKKLEKLYDLNIDEDICESNEIFSNIKNNYLLINFRKNNFIKEVKLLASKKNLTEKEIKIEFINEGQKIDTKLLTITKFPFWSNLVLKRGIKADKVKIYLPDLNKNEYGFNEIIIFK